MHKWAEFCKKDIAFLRFLLLLFNKSCICQKNVVPLRRFSRRLYVYAGEESLKGLLEIEPKGR